MDLQGRDFLTLLDYTPEEIGYLLDLAADLKAKKKAGIAHDVLHGKNVALIFEKTSTRTRCAFEVALQLLRQMWPARPVRLVGVSAEKTGTDNFEQLDLFTDTTRRQKQEKLDRTADALRRKFGGAAVTRAKLLTPETRAPAALSAAKERDKQKKK